MWSRLIVLCNPGIKIGLQLGNGAVKLLAEGNAIKLVQQRLVETFANAVRLRPPCLRARVIDVLNSKIELVLVVVRLAAELSAAVGEHATDGNLVFVEEWHHPIVHQVGGGERGLAIVELGKRYLRIGVDRRLLVDPT